MCERCPSTDFSDLDSANLDTPAPAPTTFLEAQVKAAQNPRLVSCPRCAGSGRYASYGMCFKCSGTGRATAPRPLLMDSGSVARRDRARVANAEASLAAIRAREEARAAFKAAHPQVVAWVQRRDGSHDFATSLAGKLAKDGALSDGQLGAVERILAQDAERALVRLADAPNVAGAGFTRLLECFAKASATGLKRPTLKCGDIVLSLAPATSKNPGHIYVKIGGNYHGKIAPDGRYFASRDSRPEVTIEVARIARDPMAAAVEHGRLTGACAICSRTLVDPISVERGIGPICAERFGWM